MPRVAEARTAAAPSSDVQKERHRRIIRTAARMAAERDVDQLQMQDVARESGVAIATLHRYCPSKTHLLVAVLRRQIDRLAAGVAALPDDRQGIDVVADLLVLAQGQLLREPSYACAVIGAVNVANADLVHDAARLEIAFFDLILGTARIEDPTPSDRQVVRLLAQCWFGILTTTLNGRLDPASVESDPRRACQLVLVDLGRDPR